MYKKIIIGGLLFVFSLSVLAFVGSQQAQINNFKPFLVITVVALVLGTVAYYQKSLQNQ
ncbi:hypothetical protein SPBRAN_914 [uncultured Candidatus Thioglobus sp.]|nr:hypothetical protein SPBRAN_914 [uncultured Candidatus Thioglobus sp.]